jgi:hypothetical protein
VPYVGEQVVGVPKLSRLFNCGTLFIVVCLSILVSGVVLHHLGVAEPATTIMGVVCIGMIVGMIVFCIVETYRKIKSLLGVICFGPDRCICAPDYEIALIYIEPGEKRAKQGETS